jgi:hypothetical protein
LIYTTTAIDDHSPMHHSPSVVRTYIRFPSKTSELRKVSSGWLRTIAGHWLLPISKTLNGLGRTDGSVAEAEPINMPANNSVTVHVTDFIALIIVLFLPALGLVMMLICYLRGRRRVLVLQPTRDASAASPSILHVNLRWAKIAPAISSLRRMFSRRLVGNAIVV